jgi:hypothetical protein
MRRLAAALLFACVPLLSAGCADQLPDQDRRILDASPDLKVSTDILWAEFQANTSSANERYWGKAVEVTGKVTGKTESPARIIFLPQHSSSGTEARLLDDRAAATLAAANVGERMTLRCFCAGLESNVILKSCIKP